MTAKNIDKPGLSPHLDPHTAGFLAMLDAKGVPPMHELSVEDARKAAMGYIGLQGPQQSVAEVSEHTLEVQGGTIKARVYKPNLNGNLPMVMMYHGGGFVIGNLDLIDNVARQVCAQSGAAVITIGYRKGPECRFPTPAEDAYAGLLWAVSKARELSLDSTRIATLGDSAGGNLATVVARMALDRKGPKIAHQVLVYPVVDVGGDYPSMQENGEGYMLTRQTMAWFMSQYMPLDPVEAEKAHNNPYLSVIHAKLSDMPPATIYTAGFDPLRDQGLAYAEALKNAGVEVEYVPNPTMIHGYFWMGGVIPHAAVTIQHIAGVLKHSLNIQQG
ncbi:MAG: alpha/beta hydrolase [Limnobacter sp.]|nr:alpha/beta hydrolase [Limnobacter sp.]